MLQAALTLVVVFLWSFDLPAQAPFYQGKTITIAAGTKAGDVYDLYPRLLAEYWTKHIPGNPNIIVQNVPGAASLIAANQVYNIAKPDGLTLAAIYPALYFDQLIKRPEVKYDWAKWNWLGSPVKSNQLLYMRADTPYKSMDDVRKAATARSAVPPVLRPQGTTYPNFWRRCSAPSSTSCRATCRDRISIWRWNAASSSAGHLPLPRTTLENRLSRGANGISQTCWSKRAANAMLGSRIRRRFMS